MKVNIEIDCTPEEMRRCLGLPDLVPMQEAVMAKLQERVMNAVDATAPEALLRAWMPLAPEQFQQGLANLFAAFGMAKPGGGKG